MIVKNQHGVTKNKQFLQSSGFSFDRILRLRIREMRSTYTCETLVKHLKSLSGELFIGLSVDEFEDH